MTAVAAPLKIQIEAGEHFRSLIVSWLPVTISCDTYLGTNIAGYAIYVNNIEVKRLMDPTGNLLYSTFWYKLWNMI